MNGRYILDGRKAVPCKDLLKWAGWLEAAELRVRLTRVGPHLVSTVFLGLDHSFNGGHPPLLFETMAWIEVPEHEIAPGVKSTTEFVDIQRRCSTWDEAEAQHQSVLDELRQSSDEIEELFPPMLATEAPSS